MKLLPTSFLGFAQVPNNATVPEKLNDTGFSAATGANSNETGLSPAIVFALVSGGTGGGSAIIGSFFTHKLLIKQKEKERSNYVKTEFPFILSSWVY